MSAARRVAALLVVALAAGACARPAATSTAPAPVPSATAANHSSRLDAATQLVLVTTAGWDTTGGMLRRYERASPGEAWRPVGEAWPIVVGRTGLAWGDAAGVAPDAAPIKHEGDGRAPAGRFPLDTVFGFAPASEAAWVRLPYVALTPGTDCVDDTASVHYNTVVDRGAVPRVDWASAEHMRQVDQYRLGVIVGYNAPPRAGRGSCIFLHIWAGAGSSTAGCTAMDERDLRELVLWLDRARRPVLVQLPDAEYARLRGAWGLP